MVDRLQFEVDGIEISYPGGNGLISSAVLGRQGIHVAVLGQVGDDSDGWAIKQLLERSRADLSRLRLIRTHPTKVATIRVHSNGDWNRLRACPRIFPYLPIETIDDSSWLGSFEHLHVAGLQGLLRAVPNETLRVLQLCRNSGQTLSFGLTNDSHHLNTREIIGHHDIVIGNAGEFARLLGSGSDSAQDLTDALRKSDLQYCAITRGSSAIVAKWRGELLNQIAVTKMTSRSSVGAGDVFAATLVAQVLLGRRPERAIQAAVAEASRSVVQPTWDPDGPLGGSTTPAETFPR